MVEGSLGLQGVTANEKGANEQVRMQIVGRIVYSSQRARHMYQDTGYISLISMQAIDGITL